MSQQPTAQQQLSAWLDDAYAMERGLVSILENHAGHLEDVMPAAAARLREHITETRLHATRLEQCLALLDTAPSTVKSTMSSMIGTVEGAATAFFRDHVVKDLLADYASEHFEVGCYQALVSAANVLGLPEIAELCQQNLDEDLDMAMWIFEQLPAVAIANAVRPVVVESPRS
jgi:ferritin-like metal-binding protein YciE